MSELIRKSDKIFVAGGTGTAGKAIISALKNNGYGKEGKGEILAPTHSQLDLLDNVETKDWLKKEKPDVVILAAARVGGILANQNSPADFIIDNLTIQNNVIIPSWEIGVRRLLFLGSSCIYPKYSEQPIKESELLKRSLEPTNEFYAIAKISGLKLCEALQKQYGFDAICLMPTNLYGPEDNYHPLNSHVLPAFVRKFVEAKSKDLTSVICWGTGEPTREFLHVDDFADACIYALENWDINAPNAPLDENGQKLYYLNVGSGKEIKIKDLAHLIAGIVEYKGKILWDNSKPDGTPRKTLDISKLEYLGWKPKIKLLDGLHSTIKFFKDDQLLN